MVENTNKQILLIAKDFKILSLIFLCIAVQSYKVYAKEQKYDLPYPAELVELAHSLDMEVIEEEKYWEGIITYGGQGLPYLFNVKTEVSPGQDKPPANVIFWCEKKDKRKCLVYAEDNHSRQDRYTYEVKLILSRSEMVGHDYYEIEGSYGMVIYNNSLGIDKDLSHFYYLDNTSEHGPKGEYPVASNGWLPIIMYQDSSIVVLYLYKGRWLQHVWIDE